MILPTNFLEPPDPQNAALQMPHRHQKGSEAEKQSPGSLPASIDPERFRIFQCAPSAAPR